MQRVRGNRHGTVALLETLHSEAPVGFGFVDRDFRRVLVNETLAAFNGSTVAEQVGRLVPELVPLIWPSSNRCTAVCSRLATLIADVEVDGPSQAHPSEIRHWLLSYYPVRVDDDVIGIGIVAVDNTERIRSERLHRHLAAIVENSGDAILGSTTDGIVTSWNAAAEQIVRIYRHEVIGTSMAMLGRTGRIRSSGAPDLPPAAPPNVMKASAAAGTAA